MTSTVDCFKNIKLVIDAKHQWESVMDALPQLICLIDDEGLIIRTNKTIEYWRLASVAEVRGKGLHEIFHPDCQSSTCNLKNRLKRFLPDIENSDAREFEYFDPKRKCTYQFNAHEGTKSKFQEGYSFVVISDITQEKKAQSILINHNRVLEEKLEERTSDLKNINITLEKEVNLHQLKALELQESEERYTKLVENTLTGMYITFQDKIIFCNNRFAEIFDYSKEHLCELCAKDIFCQRYNGSTNNTMRWSDERKGDEVVSAIKRDGSILWLNRFLTSFKSNGRKMKMGSVTDITSEKHIRDSLRWSKRELKNHSQKLLEIQETERKRIAHELHDSVGQSINAIKLQLENLSTNITNKWPSEAPVILNNTIKSLRDTVNEVRNISMNLRPSMLDDLGLMATIRWFIKDYQLHMPDISIKTSLEVDEKLMSDNLKLTLFRVIQEALNNVAKHAKASSVSIKLMVNKDITNLNIFDDGRGFDVRLKLLGEGFGLRSMRERVKLENGIFCVKSTKNKGTTIDVSWDCLSEKTSNKEIEKKLDTQTESRLT